MTLEEFIELYDTTEVPILPDNWRDELYDDMFQVGQYEPRGKEKENPEKGVVTPSDIMKVWKMLQAQDWFIDAFNRRDVEKDHGIAEDKWGLLVIWLFGGPLRQEKIVLRQTKSFLRTPRKFFSIYHFDALYTS